MPNPIVMLDPTSGPILPYLNPGQSMVLSNRPTILIEGKPACAITAPTILSGPVVVPLKPTVLLQGTPIALVGAVTALGATAQKGAVSKVNC